jgi:hypothetical protein
MMLDLRLTVVEKASHGRAGKRSELWFVDVDGSEVVKVGDVPATRARLVEQWLAEANACIDQAQSPEAVTGVVEPRRVVDSPQA